MTLRLIARCIFAAVFVVPAAVLAKQTFKPAQQLAYSDFKPQTAPQLSITTEAGSVLPIKVHHVSGLSENTFDARAEDIKITYTKTGMSIELRSGTHTSTKGPWRAEPAAFQTLQIELSTNAEILWVKVPPIR